MIERVLDCLETVAGRCRAAGRLDEAAARDAVTFFRGFADRCHHGKEEAHLFPLMEQRGFSPDSGPTAVMRREHEQGRELVGAMNEAIEGAAAGDKGGCDGFLRAAQGFLDLLRQHILKEDRILFPMAEQALTGADKERLREAFARVDHEEIGEAERQRLLQVAGSLAERCGMTVTDG